MDITKKEAIAQKVFQVLAEENLTIAEAESILQAVQRNLKLTKVTCQRC